ncbi:hypothetical protein OE88DRAFT_1464912 [Heliocybe sulcata]|uniref:Uncharacterized protein n=1 Tax=Heliocybe sulcata TaxID=5364 RepID=A0A5C3N1X7_9AGAM|nr:hypothetical protein OE88DRAFT_1464912 [Heliocybe sulcata]
MSTPPNPHPYPYWHHHYHRGPGRFVTRIIWFALGGFATAVWMRSHDRNGDYRPHACMRHKPREQLPTTQSEPAAPHSWSLSWPDRRDEIGTAQGPMPAPANAAPSYEQERAAEMIAEMKKKAADTAVELSEATLDSILSTVTSLKAKLAERSARLDEENKRLRQEVEDLKRRPPRLV